MKKLMAVLLCAMLVSGCALTASAYDSPDVQGGSDTTGSDNGGDADGGKDKGSDSDKNGSSSNGSSSNGSSSNNSSTSPKTGAPVSYGVLMAAAALAFGGVALSSKKKIEEN